MTILAIIPARGGSKGVPRKNIIPINGIPLIGYTAAAIQQSHCLTDHLVSTDDAEIAAVSRAQGLQVPFMRPAHLAEDASPTQPVITHALEWYAATHQKQVEIIVLLQPTTPLRTGADIDNAVQLLQQTQADSVVSVTALPKHAHPDWQFQVADGQLLRLDGANMMQLPTRRQALSTTYTRNGAIYAFWARTLQDHNSIYGPDCRAYIMPEDRSINIDTPADIALLQAHVSQS